MKVFVASLLAGALCASVARAADKPNIEFYAVIDCSPGDAAPRRDPSSGSDICLSPRHLLGGTDVVGLASVDQPAGEVLGVKLGPVGAAALHHFTLENVGHRMAIMIDGKLLSAPTILDVISGDRAYIDHLTHNQIASLVARFYAQPPI
jgi:preprotein translocase subunit SecD